MNKVKIIGLPFAGGNQYSYDRFKQFLPSNFVLKTVEFPGRGQRLEEESLCDIVKIARDVLRQVKEDIQTSEYIIYGHSMGTLVGYELTKEILRSRYRSPSCLFFTGRAGPSIDEEDQISSYSKEAFWNEINNMGGLPPELISNEDLLDFFEPILRADIRAVEQYIYRPMLEPFGIPIHVIASDGESDITPEKLERWQRETIFPIYQQFISGNHFFIFENPNRIVQEIVKAYKMYK